MEIITGHVSKDRVHLFVPWLPHISASYLMQRIKGKSSRKLLQQFSQIWNKQCWGRHPRARGFFLASSGVVTGRASALIEYIRTQDLGKSDGEFLSRR